jgi:hypothetical protein
MASEKRLYTKIFLKEANIQADEKTIKQYIRKIWKNPRDKLQGSLSLSKDGFNFVVNTLKLKFYIIDVKEIIEINKRLILELEKNIKYPYYIEHNKLFLFDEKTASYIILMSGDLKKFNNIANQRKNLPD